MPDELKDKFQQLVADPPPPTAVPSEAVFAKVRTVRRRRTAGVAVLAAAAVAAIAVAGNSLTDIDSSPPVSGPPSASIPAPSAPNTSGNATVGTVGATRTTGSGSVQPTAPAQPTSPGLPVEPSTSGTQTHNPPPTPPVGVTVVLLPKLTGKSLTMKVTVKGSLISPLGIEGDGSKGVELPADTSFLNRTLGTTYLYGDGEQSGSDGGAVTCTGAKKRVASQETYTLLDGPHVYKTPGTYTFKYTVQYCGAKNQTLQATKTARIVVH
jgi:hypothetical protein